MGAGLSQATSQLKSMGSEAQSSAGKVKASGLGIGASISLITTQIVSTVNSIISLKRQWEDLVRADNDVIQSHNSLQNRIDGVKKATINLSAAQKGGGKASALDLKIAHTDLAIAIEKYGKGSVQAAKAQSALNKLQGKGGVDTDKVTKAQLALNRAQRLLTNSRITDKEVVVNQKRAYEDFYLATIPTAIGIVGSLATAIATIQSSGGITGIGTSLLKWSPILIGIAAGFFALKTNLLGITTFFQNLGRDIGNAIPALKPLLTLIESLFAAIGIGPKKEGIKNAFSDLVKQIQPIIDFFKGMIDTIMKGDWDAAFKKITEAATAAWTALKKAFPLLGDIESLVNKIKGGNWKGALLQIWLAATSVWETIKKNIPFLGDIETFIRAIAEGKWDVAFAAIIKAIDDSGIKQAIGSIFDALGGKDTPEKTGWVTKIITEVTQIPEKLKAAMSGGKGKGDPFGGTGIIDTIIGLKDWSVDGFIAAFKTKLTEGFKLDSWWGDDPNPPGKQMLDGFFASANTWIKTNVDAFVASLLNIETWTKAFEANLITWDSAANFLTMITDALFGKADAKTGKNKKAENNAAVIGQAIVEGIFNWFRDVMPHSKQVLNGAVNFWKGLGTAIASVPASILKTAVDIANSLINSLVVFFSPESMAKVVTKLLSSIRSAVNNAKDILVDLGKYIWQRIWQAFSGAASFALGGLGWVGNELQKLLGLQKKATGFHGIVTGPTMFMAGEKGAEQVDVTTRADMMTQKKPSGGTGTMNVNIPVILDGQVIAEVVAKRISVNQSTYR